MTLRFQASAQGRRRSWAACTPVICAFLALTLLSGCVLFRREMPRPGRTKLDSELVIVPAVTLSNYLVVEAKWDKRGPYHFLIDTGASVTLVSPDLAARYGAKNAAPTATPLVRVKSATGETALLTSTTLRRIELGGARFENVQALIYDCAALSAHLGVHIDGILGFPLFRETLLTLDYPRSRVLLQNRSASPLLPGTTISFNNDRKTPIIPLRLGDQTFVALIDSGSDVALSLNPIGLNPTYVTPPRPGATVTTLSGDRTQRVARLADTLFIGDYPIQQPIVDLTDELTSIGGGLLKFFTVTFDQEHSHVTFHRPSKQPIPPKTQRSSGMSFDKTPAYWRIASVIPGSPAAAVGVQDGDLVTRINDEPVANWDLARYQQLIASADEVEFTFLNGTQETVRNLKIFDLIP